MLHEILARSIFDPGILLKTVCRQGGRLVMADVDDRWSQLQDSTDFDQCILRPKDSTRDSANKKEACSLQMVIMIKRRVAKAFAKPRVYTSKAAWWCMQSFSCIPKVWVGVVSVMAIVGMLPPVQIYSKCGFPSGPGLKLLLELPKSNS